MSIVKTELITLDKIPDSLTEPFRVEATVLRLDRIHPIISGNKWFKLRFHLEQVQHNSNRRIVTWGGAWSNHLVATAAACLEYGIPSLGLVRGERPATYAATLKEAEDLGMRLQFLSRADYRNKLVPSGLLQDGDWMIPEGGYGELGAKGAATIASHFEQDQYTHILCAVGTGTMMAGLIQASGDKKKIVGIPVLQGAEALRNSIQELVDPAHTHWSLEPGFEWGGYAKHPEGLIQFMNEFYVLSSIPTDIVYTGKLIYAFLSLMKDNYFPFESRILLIHSGGLQGNRSLEKGRLSFG